MQSFVRSFPSSDLRGAHLTDILPRPTLVDRSTAWPESTNDAW